MALFHITRRCDDCEKTREQIEALRREVRNALLDYENLYDKVRTNLGKLAKRQKASEMAQEERSNGDEGDPLARYRRALVERKLSKIGGS